MKEKYYTPDIEDIKIGYECEYTSENENRFIPIKINYDFLLDYYRDEYYLLNCEFRTPYLTRKQIEQDGWNFKQQMTETDEFYQKNIHENIYTPHKQKT